MDIYIWNPLLYMESESTVKIPEPVPFWYENVLQTQLSYFYKKSFAQVQKGDIWINLHRVL